MQRDSPAPGVRPHAIGGYFELELPHGSERYPLAYRTQSGRAAFSLLLQELRPRRVWIPRYICDSMLEPLRMDGIQFDFYNLTADFCVADETRLARDDLLLYVNYFGLRGSYLPALRERFSPDRLILDNTQAFYASPEDCVAAIYSPRKFFGVPDGGYLATGLRIAMPPAISASSLARSGHLLKRLGGEPESGYGDYQVAENSLSGQPPKLMSRLTQRMLASIDYSEAQRRRRSNFSFLHQRIGGLNQLRLPSLMAPCDTPLCYPFLSQDGGLRAELARARIYTPTYWHEVEERVAAESVERMWLDRLVPLPIDQRYEISDMQRIVDIVQPAGRSAAT